MMDFRRFLSRRAFTARPAVLPCNDQQPAVRLGHHHYD
jgi:hypothetical protein